MLYNFLCPSLSMKRYCIHLTILTSLNYYNYTINYSYFKYPQFLICCTLFVPNFKLRNMLPYFTVIEKANLRLVITIILNLIVLKTFTVDFYKLILTFLYTSTKNTITTFINLKLLIDYLIV